MSKTSGVDLSFTIENDLSKVASDLRPETLMKAALAGGEVIRGAAKVNINKNFKRSHGDSGLAGSLEVKVVRSTASECEVSIGPTAVHGRIHELGGTIKPVRAKFLAIPLTAEAGKYESPRSYPGALHFVGDEGGGVLADASGEAIYALTTSVTMPPRPYLRPAVDENPGRISAAMGEQLRIGIERSAANGST